MNTTTNVAVLAWGSLVNQTYSPVYQASLDIEGAFQEAGGLKLPIRMSRLSSMNTENRRYTLVIDKNASDEKVYAATSKYHNFELAKENLRVREGTTAKNISYLKLGRPQAQEDQYNVMGQTWSGKIGSQLTAEKAHEIIVWAQHNNFQGVIWTGLEPNVNTGSGSSGNRGREILEPLQNDPVLLRNTKDYIRNLPYTTQLQRQILNM